MADKGDQMRSSTIERAAKLYGTISGRIAYGDPAEKFENVTLMLHRPLSDLAASNDVWVKLYEAGTMKELTEENYFIDLRELYNQRNPHAMVGEFEDDDADFEELPPEDDIPADDDQG